ncbi:MAG: hypothetical protein ACT4P9_02330 [Betaproteobacteria bacterium]
MAGLLSACESVPYIPPRGAATATLVIENANSAPLSARTYADAANCTDPRQIHEGIRAGGPVTVAVPSGRPFALWTRVEFPQSSKRELIGRISGLIVCSGSIEFVPSPGQRYVVRYEYKGGDKRCDVLLAEEYRFQDGTARRTPIQHRLRMEGTCK